MGKKSLKTRFHLANTYLILAILTAFLCLLSPSIYAIPIISLAANPIASDRMVSPDLLERAKNLYDRKQYTEAVIVLQQAIQDYQTQGNSLKQALALSNLSSTYQQLGLWSEANRAINESLKLLHQKPNNDRDRNIILAQTLNIQGRLQIAQGQLEQALERYQDAINIYEQLKDEKGAIESRIYQGQALQELGLYPKAIATLTQVNQTLQPQPDSLIKAVASRSLGDALLVTGDLKQAREILQKSLKIAEHLQLKEAVAATKLSLGNLTLAEAIAALSRNNLTPKEAILQLNAPHKTNLSSIHIGIEKQKTEAAQAFYQQTETALNFYQQANRQADLEKTKLQAQLARFSLLIATQREKMAQELYRELQSPITKLPPSHANIYNQINFAQSAIALNKKNPVEMAKLLAIASQKAQKLGDPRAHSYALGILGQLYEQNQQLTEARSVTQQALMLSQAINATDISYRWQWQLGRLLKLQGDRAGAISAYSEAVQSLQSLRDDLVAVNRDVQFSFRESVEPVYRQLVDLLLTTEGNARPNLDSLIQARNLIEGLQVAELDNFFREACLDTQIALDRVVDSSNLSAAIFYTIVLPDRLEVILKIPQQKLIHYVTNIPQEQVENTADTLMAQLKTPYASKNVQALAKQLYDWLIRPAETALAEAEVETLVFLQDGVLRNIPMAVLYDGQNYLIEKYPIAIAPATELSAPKPLQKENLRVLVAALSESRRNFPPLIFVEQEVAQIKSTLPAEVLFNQSFTQKNFEQQIDLSPYSIVHIATHGQFSSQAEETFILAWDNPIDVNNLGRLLRSRELDRPEPLELLVLSACETATGDNRATLGLAGVAVRSGARSTLASLWSIEDRSAALLMKTFYQELAKNPVSKAEALRRAQRSLLANRQYESPYFWAPYVLLGNWL